MGKKFLEHITKKKLQKTNKKEFRIEKVIKKKDDKLYVKWKGYNHYKNISEYYLRANVKIELYVYTYATKVDLKMQ